MSIQECLYGEAGPGQVFKLDENSLIGYVEDLEDTMIVLPVPMSAGRNVNVTPSRRMYAILAASKC